MDWLDYSLSLVQGWITLELYDSYLSRNSLATKQIIKVTGVLQYSYVVQQ